MYVCTHRSKHNRVLLSHKEEWDLSIHGPLGDYKWNKSNRKDKYKWSLLYVESEKVKTSF